MRLLTIALLVTTANCFVLTATFLEKFQNNAQENVSCTECKDIVNVMFEVANNATVRAELIADVNGTCLKLFVKKPHEAQLCIEYGDDIVNKLLPWIDKELETLAWDAQAVCSNFVKACLNPCCNTSTVPEQLHLSIAGPNAMAITWTTLDNTSTHTVQWGTSQDPLSQSSNGWTRTYTDGGWIGVVHTAVMDNLEPNTQYTYRVGDALGGWSKLWTFTTLPTNAGTSQRPLRIVQIGDMGYAEKSDDTVAAITAMVENGTVDLILHVGDVSYADGDMPHWDIFLRKIEPIAASVPYMTNPGNHELWYNFTAYKTRFWTPASSYADHRMFYSFDYGGVHFTQMNTETFEDTADINKQQAQWLASDLSGHNKTIFTIATGHRPLYCSNDKGGGKDCGTFAQLLRKQAEELLLGNHVDLVLTAHMHGYERSWPAAHGQPTALNYNYPASPVYIVNGAGGNREGNPNPSGNLPWCVPGKHTAAIGFAKIVIADRRLSFTFLYSSNSTEFDAFEITK